MSFIKALLKYYLKEYLIADDVVVNDAVLKDGLLKVYFERVIPEDKKPKVIKIKTKYKSLDI